METTTKCSQAEGALSARSRWSLLATSSKRFQRWLIFTQAKIDAQRWIISVVRRDERRLINSDQASANHSFSYAFSYPVIWLSDPCGCWLIWIRR